MILDLEDESTQLAIRTLVGNVPLCGCGSSDAMWLIVKAALERASEPIGDRKGSFYSELSVFDADGEEHKLPPLATEFVAQVLSSHAVDALEHGGSVGYSWVTDQGKVLLAFLRALPNPDAWPEWVTSSEGDEPFELERAALRQECHLLVNAK